MAVSLDLVLVSFCFSIWDNYQMFPDIQGENTLLGGVLAGNNNVLHCLSPNAAAGKNVHTSRLLLSFSMP
jgi:hypothetical protein